MEVSGTSGPGSLPAGRQGFLSDVIKLYVIRSEKNGDLYVGICKDVPSRLQDHENGKNCYTKGLRPWKLVLTEEYPDWKNARKREKYFKSGSGKEHLKKILAP